jgi:hypothetical protein
LRLPAEGDGVTKREYAEFYAFCNDLARVMWEACNKGNACNKCKLLSLNAKKFTNLHITRSATRRACLDLRIKSMTSRIVKMGTRKNRASWASKSLNISTQKQALHFRKAVVRLTI